MLTTTRTLLCPRRQCDRTREILHRQRILQGSSNENIGKDPMRGTGQHLARNLTRPEETTALQRHGGDIRKSNNGR